jgi:hypothetical protein
MVFRFFKLIFVLFIMLGFVWATGCDEEDHPRTSGSDGDADGDGDDDGSCKDGNKRCVGEMVKECQSGVWTDWDDCEAQGLVCAIMDGEPSCVEAGSGSDGDADGDIDMDCSSCAATGGSLDNMLCAIDLCDQSVLNSQTYTSPTGHTPLEISYQAVAKFGTSADLNPREGSSYALMASGQAEGTEHNGQIPHPNGGLTQSCPGGGLNDPFNNDPLAPICEAVEWTLNLTAPSNANGFSFDYIFFSTEYDEYVGTQFNDRFYVFLEAASTNSGTRTVINFTGCRSGSSDFNCSDGMTGCDPGESYCYIAINTALSECCWLTDCNNTQHTDITGTGFACAPTQQDECLGTQANGMCADGQQGINGSSYGSSTGWLRTEWTIEPGEQFKLVFHIHDTSDSILDSEVILDNFKFKEGETKPGTGSVY